MKTDLFDYELPESAIAQEPAEPRDAARLFVHRRAEDQSTHAHVRDLPGFLAPGDLLVVNDTRVRPARLFGRRATGGRVELLLVEREPRPGHWRALVRPAKRLSPGEVIDLEDGSLHAVALERSAGEDGAPGAEWRMELIADARHADVESAVEAVGRLPLPPYVRRERDGDERSGRDRERYQTVYAAQPGAIAAPTAGLHFTPGLLDAVRARGVDIASVTLHVGLGTFQPMAASEIEQHVMHSESYVLPEATARACAAARARGGRVIAIGTTSARVLESCADEHGVLRPGAGATRLFITPGRPFRAIDGLLTNFHLPRSTLLVLVSALAGRERVLRLYREALELGYRFYSYGDAQLYL